MKNMSLIFEFLQKLWEKFFRFKLFKKLVYFVQRGICLVFDYHYLIYGLKMNSYYDTGSHIFFTFDFAYSFHFFYNFFANAHS